ncbi:MULTISPECIES: hypothetical protein [unclassified Burkholderia]|uniref:hypothetical protein n=1 Tax=unclassified Burkholderia TaxID=2613784 RepID=UPI0015C5B9FE|nr:MULTISPECIES: hypothetical protein [unclassified Burkholderia]
MDELYRMNRATLSGNPRPIVSLAHSTIRRHAYRTAIRQRSLSQNTLHAQDHTLGLGTSRVGYGSGIAVWTVCKGEASPQPMTLRALPKYIARITSNSLF